MAQQGCLAVSSQGGLEEELQPYESECDQSDKIRTISRTRVDGVDFKYELQPSTGGLLGSSPCPIAPYYHNAIYIIIYLFGLHGQSRIVPSVPPYFITCLLTQRELAHTSFISYSAHPSYIVQPGDGPTFHQLPILSAPHFPLQSGGATTFFYLLTATTHINAPLNSRGTDGKLLTLQQDPERN